MNSEDDKKMAKESASDAAGKPSVYSARVGAARAFRSLLAACGSQLSVQHTRHVGNVTFAASRPVQDVPVFPCPMRQQEATAAIRALEGIAAAALSDLRYEAVDRAIYVDMSKTACYLMSAYITTIDALDKSDPRTKGRIPDTDIHGAQSTMYRRLSANMYKTKIPGQYYHIHGSLEASRTLQMIGLEPFRPELKEYRRCLETISSAVRQFTSVQLEAMNAENRQAGAPCLTRDEFKNTSHGRAMGKIPPFTIEPLEMSTPPTQLPSKSSLNHRHVLEGVRVLELCRVIAGPTIGRALAAHGAAVLKVTSPQLGDIPFFQLDVNHGKHTTSLHLRCPKHRAIFEDLLATTDVVVDGYRPNALETLGYGPKKLAQLAKARGRGIVYISEDCFGGSGLATGSGADWAHRPGWQQIADCVTGVAWEQGRFMGLNEPVVPPFPMSDYGTGALGCVAALIGLHKRATEGGSWVGRTSLVQYDMFLLSLGLYPTEVQTHLRNSHSPEFFKLRHDDSVDEIGRIALLSIKQLHPDLFGDDMVHESWSKGFNGILRWPRDALIIKGLRVGHLRTTRPNGFDAPSWEDWEIQDDLLHS